MENILIIKISFCFSKTVEKFSYCPFTFMIVYQPKGKKKKQPLKDDDVPTFFENITIKISMLFILF